MKKIIVLGGHGFVGTAVTNQLKKMNHEVFPLSRSDGLDLLDLKSTEKYFSDIQPNIIINCAAHVGSLHYVSDFCADILFDNLQMITNIYKVVQKLVPECLIINPIANCGYPPHGSILKEENFMGDDVHSSVYAYGHSRRMLYVTSKMYWKQYGIKSNNFLIPNSYGPGDSINPNKVHAINGMIIRLIKAKKSNDLEFVIWGSGSPIREWAYVSDVSKLLINSINHHEPLTEPINLGKGEGVSIKDSAKAISKLLNYKGRLTYDTSLQDGAPKKVMCGRKFQSIFPDFEFTDHVEGLQKTINYYWDLI